MKHEVIEFTCDYCIREGRGEGDLSPLGWKILLDNHSQRGERHYCSDRCVVRGLLKLEVPNRCVQEGALELLRKYSFTWTADILEEILPDRVQE